MNTINNFKNSLYYMELYREEYDSVFWKECSWIYKCHFIIKDKITNREIVHLIINEKDCMNLVSMIYNYIQFNQGEAVIPFYGNTTNPDIYMIHIYLADNINHPTDSYDTIEYLSIKKYNSLEQSTIDLVKFELVESYHDDIMNLSAFACIIYDTFLYDIDNGEMYNPDWML